MALRYINRLVATLCASVGFVLVMLALFAGNSPGVLEEYDLLLVNTSSLGNGKPATTEVLMLARTTAKVCDPFDGILDKECDSAILAGGATGDGINKVAHSLADKAHIRDFYSLHALAVCEGDFAADGSRNIAACHSYFSDNATITALLQRHLSGHNSDNTTLASSLGLPPSLESDLDALNALFKAAAVIFAIGVVLTGASLPACMAGLLLPRAADKNDTGSSLAASRVPWHAWLGLCLAACALFFLILGGLVATIGARIAAGKVNDSGGGVGVSAAAGTDWLRLAWVGVLLMGVVLAYWVLEVVLGVRRRRGRPREDLEGGYREKVPMRGLLSGVQFSSVRRK